MPSAVAGRTDVYRGRIGNCGPPQKEPIMRARRALPLLVLAIVAACESPSTAPRRPGPAAASSNVQTGEPAYACTGFEYERTFHDVVVPAGESCILAYGTVSGSVRVLAGAHIYSAESHIAGNFKSENAASIDLAGGVVEGDIIIDGNVSGEGPSLSHLIAGVTLTRGDVRITGNVGIGLAVRDNDIAGNLWVHGNANSSVFSIANRVGQAVHVVLNRGAGGIMVRSTSARQIRCEANTTPIEVAENEAPLMLGQCEVR